MNYSIIGGTGTLGNQLTERIIADDPNNHIWIFSRDENKQWMMKKKFNDNASLHFVIGDVCDIDALTRFLHMANPHIIILAAALKHIDICEDNPYISINTNILGTKNCIESIRNNIQHWNNLEKFLFISTDKACNPINVYGQCKSISEKLVLYASRTIDKIKFLCVRYGNVFDSRGSLIDLLKNNNLEYLPLTHPEMTRFFMTRKEAESLIFDALERGSSGELWIRKAPSFLIKNVIQYFSIKYNKEIKVIGLRTGEKLHEELFSIYEDSQIIQDGDYFILKPVKYDDGHGFHNYSSLCNNLTYEETVEYIENNLY